MKEQEWFKCADPALMLRCLRRLGVSRRQAGRRKLRLFGCACVRRHWDRATDPRSRALVEVAERYADGLAERREMTAAERRARAALNKGESLAVVGKTVRMPPWCCWSYAELSDTASPQPAWEFALVVTLLPRYLHPPKEPGPEDRAQAALLRDVFGNPFRPAALDSSSRTSTVVALAQAAHDERLLPAGTLDKDRLAVLADALEDAGCDNAEILSHCRSPGPHVRGCWLIDLILGKG